MNLSNIGTFEFARSGFPLDMRALATIPFDRGANSETPDMSNYL